MLDGSALTLPYSVERDITLYAKWISEDEYADGDGDFPWSAIKLEKKELRENGWEKYYVSEYDLGRNSDCRCVYVSDYDGTLNTNYGGGVEIYTVGENGKLIDVGMNSCLVETGKVYYFKVVKVVSNNTVTFSFKPSN